MRLLLDVFRLSDFRRLRRKTLPQIAGENLIGSKIVLPEAAAGHRAILDRLRNPELLPHQGTLRGSRGDQRQHPHADQPRPGLQEHALHSAQSKAHDLTNTEYVAFR